MVNSIVLSPGGSLALNRDAQTSVNRRRKGGERVDRAGLAAGQLEPVVITPSCLEDDPINTFYLKA